MHRMAADRGAYWQSASQDTTMQDEHAFIWEAMLNTIDVDLTGQRVLDAGCNRGGVLRLVCERARIDAGFGYDPAPAAIADARRLAGERPLTFEAADTVLPGWGGFDVAFSHEVLYLLHDLDAHAEAIRRALASGGVYYAVIGVHAASPGVAEWHAENARSLNLPRLYRTRGFTPVRASARERTPSSLGAASSATARFCIGRSRACAPGLPEAATLYQSPQVPGLPAPQAHRTPSAPNASSTSRHHQAATRLAPELRTARIA
jgi:SAM-dependent methyltransferase